MVTRVQAAPATGPADPLETLAAEADAADRGQRIADAMPMPEPRDEGEDVRAEAREAVEVIASLALPFVGMKWGAEVAAAYGPAQLDKIGKALGDVAVKRGWSVGGILSEWGPELALCAALAGPVLPRLIAAAQAKQEPQPQPQRAPEGPRVQGVNPPPDKPPAELPAAADDGRVE